MTMPTRQLPMRWLHTHEPINVLLIGAGGNGAEFFDGLMRLHQAMIALGSAGLQVTVMDDDEVTPSNIVRQRFWPHEIGENKAVALASRTNLIMGTTWNAVPTRFTQKTLTAAGRADLIVTAVDNRKTRHLLGSQDKHDNPFMASTLWLDMGCDRDKGQVVLGQLGDNDLGDSWPTAAAHFPDLMNDDDPAADRPSCSAADSLSRQDLMINQTVAGAAINLLWKSLRTGTVPYNGVMIDLAEGSQQAIPFFPVADQSAA
ncbi:MAG: UBA/THIF-type NAD/FAD binding protein [Marinobacter sp. T13-3]|nr:MAG: UBA/THIF-type NAD/FAD binding protein [Marinobacter sp. T13-3]